MRVLGIHVRGHLDPLQQDRAELRGSEPGDVGSELVDHLVDDVVGAHVASGRDDGTFEPVRTRRFRPLPRAYGGRRGQFALRFRREGRCLREEKREGEHHGVPRVSNQS